MLPISSADLVEFSPARERLTKALAVFDACMVELDAAKSVKPKDKGAIAAAETAVDDAKNNLSDAEAEFAKCDPVYNLRVPTERTRARVNHDLLSEGLVIRSNNDLIDVILEAAHEISPDDAKYISAVKLQMIGDTIPDADWPKVQVIALTIPTAARIIADRILRNSMFRIHSIRHHLVLDGKRSPLSEKDFDDMARSRPQDVAAIGDKIHEMLTISKVEAKN